MPKIGTDNIFKMLGDSTRLEIVRLLIDNKMTVNNIVSMIKCEQPLVSHKLKELRETGILKSYRVGKNIVYEISDEAIIDVIKSAEKAGNIMENICNCAECEDKP